MGTTESDYYIMQSILIHNRGARDSLNYKPIWIVNSCPGRRVNSHSLRIAGEI